MTTFDIEYFISLVWYVLFETERDGITGEWRKLHYEELNDLYCSPSIVRVIY